MKKRIRIRKTLLVAVFAGVTVMALAPAAGAAQVTGEQNSGSAGCSVDRRIEAHEPQLCSSQYAGIDSEEIGESSETPASGMPTGWPLYLVGGLTIAAAATFSALRGRPQAVS